MPGEKQYALCRSVGAGVPFFFEGETEPVVLEPMRLVDWGLLEQILLLERKKTFPMDNMPEDYVDALEKVARSATLEEIFEYGQSDVGAPWRLYLSLRKRRRYEQCKLDIQTLLKANRFREYITCANQADGIDHFALLDWPVFKHSRVIQMAKGQSQKERDLDWKVEVHVLCEMYGMSPESVGNLTIYQFRMLQWSIDSLKGNQKLTREQTITYQHLRKMGMT